MSPVRYAALVVALSAVFLAGLRLFPLHAEEQQRGAREPELRSQIEELLDRVSRLERRVAQLERELAFPPPLERGRPIRFLKPDKNSILRDALGRPIGVWGVDGVLESPR